MKTIDRRTLMVSAGSAAVLMTLPRLAFSAATKGPPVARVEPVTEIFFGKSVTDPYRWMENEKLFSKDTATRDYDDSVSAQV